VVAVIRRGSLLATACALAVACGGSSGGDLLGPAHSGSGGSAAGSGGNSGAGGVDAGSDAAPDSSAGGNATAGGSAGASGSAGTGAGGMGGSAATGGAGMGGAAGSAGSTATPTPGSIRCGAAPCGTQLNVCCVCTGCFPKLTVCYPRITGCTTGRPLYCDDKADCTNGKVCCAHFDSSTNKFLGASCDTSCPYNGNAQLCTTNGECKGSTHCLPLASVTGFNACQ